MADEDQSPSEKEHEPSQKKLDDARKRGEIARSADLNTAASYFGFFIAASALGATNLRKLGDLLANMIRNSDAASGDLFAGGARALSGGWMAEVGILLAPLLMIPALAVLLFIIAQKGFVVAPEKLKPKLSKISPLSNAKNKFGRSGLFEFFKSFVKLTIYSIILGAFLWRNLPEMLTTIRMTPGLVTVELLSMCLDFLVLVLIIAAVMGGIDFAWQRGEHLRKNRMSRKEMMDEHKHSEGDPHMKQQRRQRGYEIAMSKMLTDVPSADVIIVNPTHYAVALKWSRTSGTAPICVAKGVDEIAGRIREIAAESGVPIHRDPPTARAIFATIEVGQEILPDQYQAVAVAIRFAEGMRAKANATNAGAQLRGL